MHSERPVEAVDILRAAVQIEPHYTLARAWIDLGKYDEAVLELDRAIVPANMKAAVESLRRRITEKLRSTDSSRSKPAT